jgi:hypothetical protein
MRGDPDPPLYLGLSWQILPMQIKAFCESVYSEKVCLSNYLIICHNLGPVSPTVAGTSGGGIEMETLFFVVEGQQPQGAADEEGGGGGDGSAL